MALDYFLKGRLFEWVMTLTMLMMAIELIVYPMAIRSSAFYWITKGPGTEFINLFLVVVGVGRAFGLLLNGHKYAGVRLGPWVRSICAVLCSAMWGQFVMSLLRASLESGYPSPGIPLWLNITLGELYIAYRALVNAR